MKDRLCTIHAYADGLDQISKTICPYCYIDTLRTEKEALEAEVERLKKEVKESDQSCLDYMEESQKRGISGNILKQRAEQAEAQNTKLIKALKKAEVDLRFPTNDIAIQVRKDIEQVLKETSHENNRRI